MKSDDHGGVLPPDHSVFQIGKRVLLTIEAKSRLYDVLDLGDSRSIDIETEAYIFRLCQLQQDVTSAALPVPVQPGIGSLPESLSISRDDWHAFLKNLFGMAVSVLRLQADEAFRSVAQELLAKASRQVPMQLFQIRSAKGKVAIVPRRSNLQANDLVVFLGDKLTVGRIEVLEESLVDPASRDRLLGIRSAGDATGKSAIVIGSKGVGRAEIGLSSYTSFQDLYNAHERDNFDLVSLLSQMLDNETIPTEGSRLPDKFHDRRLDVRFEVTDGLSLENGFFVSGWFFDQDAQITEAVVVDHTLEDPSLAGSWKIFHGRSEFDGEVRTIQRFVGFLPRKPGRRSPQEVRLRVSLRNGLSYVVAPKRAPFDLRRTRDALLGNIAGYAFSLEQFNDVFQPAIKTLQRKLNALQRVRDKREFGNRSTRMTSIIVPIYREMDFLRSQLMAFALDPYIREQCEIIYCVDDPTIALPFTSMMSAHATAFPLDVRVITLDRNGGYALANNFAIQSAAGDNLILLNSDVIPVCPGWAGEGFDILDRMPQNSAVGPKLLYPDKSIQHAGMYFQRSANKLWQNVHFYKGYGRELPSANIDREVPAVTGACMFMKKADYLAAGGFSEDYVVGDFEDSDLCLKLRRKGGVAYYAASIELYHFERQSVGLQSDPVGLASTLYNEALHTCKWDSEIATVNDVAIAFGTEGRISSNAESGETMFTSR